jgi:hypothetical protein
MTLERKRKNILVLIGAAFEARPFWQEIQYCTPVPGNSYPNATKLPSLHIDRSVEAMADLPNISRETDFPLELIGTCLSPHRLTYAKIDLEDEIEETLYSLLRDDDFRALATQIKVTGCDPTPYALAPLGATIPILPPFGVVRLTVSIVFLYGF